MTSPLPQSPAAAPLQREQREREEAVTRVETLEGHSNSPDVELENSAGQRRCACWARPVALAVPVLLTVCVLTSSKTSRFTKSTDFKERGPTYSSVKCIDFTKGSSEFSVVLGEAHINILKPTA